MKRVLVVAYYFPPMGMGGVQRAQKFVKYLPEFGWEPIVLTVRNTAYYADDPALNEEIGSTRVIRTESFDPLRILGRVSGSKPRVPHPESRMERWNRRLQPWLFIPDSKVLWIPFALNAARSLLRTVKPDMVFTTSPPHSAHLTGYRLKAMGLPWVADFRDHWLAESYESVPTAWHRAANRFLLNRVLARADRVIAVSKPILNDLIKRTNRPERFTHIPNGFDRKDFDGVSAESSSFFTIVYCGTLSPIRRPDVFLDAASEAVKRNPELSEALRIRFVGSVYGFDLPAAIRKFELEEQTEIVGYVTHRESIRQLMNADLLLLLISGDSSGGVVTGKIFEYIASGKPILAIVPPGEAERLILSCARGAVVRPNDREGLTGQILRAFDLWKRNDLRVTRPRWEGLDVLERREQTRKLAEIFRQVVLHD
jgi:glycosyltransferase involved in cell wall biosynthesis